MTIRPAAAEPIEMLLVTCVVVPETDAAVPMYVGTGLAASGVGAILPALGKVGAAKATVVENGRGDICKATVLIAQQHTRGKRQASYRDPARARVVYSITGLC